LNKLSTQDTKKLGKALPSKVQIEQRERCRESFRYFIRKAWPVIEPGTPLVWNWHIDAIAEHLSAVYHGDIHRLVCNIAPGHMKSTIFSVMWPAWCWINEPEIRWLCASHSMDLAIRDNRNCRMLIESDWYQQNFGTSFKMSGDQNMKSYFENHKRGYRLAVSVGSKGTGKRASHLLIDDPNNAEDGDAELEATRRWFGSTWLSRLNDQEHGAMVVVGQRLHQQDLTGHILELGDWTHLCLPTEYEPTRKSLTVFGNGRIWEDPRTNEGDLLWEEKFPRVVLDTLKRGLGSMAYAAQYQQTPIPDGGGQFKQKWFRYFSVQDGVYCLETPEGVKHWQEAQCWKYETVDLAISQKQTADYTVISTWAVTPEKDLLLIDRIRERLDNPEQQQQISLSYQRYKHNFIKVENVAYQLALIQQLRRQGLPIREYKPVKDKVSRASTASVYYEGGKVYHPKHAPWLHEWEEELLMFPKGTHDDQVDTLSMACEELAGFEPSADRYLDTMKQFAQLRAQGKH
jgi:predicted phage terminase large subunit-like protein